jgi:hypothetical protein
VRWVVALLVLGVAGSVYAQADPTTTTATAPTTLLPPGQTPPRCCRKSPGTALTLSLVPTLAGFVLLAAGSSPERATTNDWLVGSGLGLMFVGPSFGHAYARDLGSTGLALRLSGAAVIGACALVIATSSNTNNPGALIGAIGLCGGGAAATLIGIVTDIATAPSAARRYNRRHGFDVDTTLTPMQTRSGLAPGAGLIGRF